MLLEQVNQLLAKELDALNQTIIDSLQSQVDVIENMGEYLINAGGKRIRPIVTLLACKVCQVPDHTATVMAAIIEFIHTATLLHDDVVDGSSLRRGRPTANHVWDNASAVLVGDFLYSRAFQMMVGLGKMAAMDILADATNAIAEGEVLQLSQKGQPDLKEANYFQVIRLKTATLFEAAAMLGTSTDDTHAVLKPLLGEYGTHLGNAFQIIDDMLDYKADSETLGKNLGDDFAEGKVTLPLIYALEKATAKQKTYIQQAIKQGGLDDFSLVQETIETTGAIDYTMAVAQKEADKAKAALVQLPSSQYTQAMAALVDFALARGH